MLVLMSYISSLPAALFGHNPYNPPAFHPSQSLQHPTGANSITQKMRQHLPPKLQVKPNLHSVRSAEYYAVRNSRLQRLQNLLLIIFGFFIATHSNYLWFRIS